jgi:hypothetical protein
MRSEEDACIVERGVETMRARAKGKHSLRMAQTMWEGGDNGEGPREDVCVQRDCTWRTHGRRRARALGAKGAYEGWQERMGTQMAYEAR